MRDGCEAIQHFGNCHEADGATAISEAEALERVKATMAQVQREYKEAESTLRAFFGPET